MRCYLACARRGTHKTKNRVEVSGGNLMVVDGLPFTEPKTKLLAGLVQKDLGLTGKVLVVFDGENEALELAARNHPRIDAVRALQVHAYHVLDHETVLISRAAVEQLGEVLSR